MFYIMCPIFITVYDYKMSGYILRFVLQCISIVVCESFAFADIIYTQFTGERQL